jgi:hypothetical protein
MKKDFPYLVKSLSEFFWLYTLIRPRKINKMMLLQQFEKNIERLNKMSQKKIRTGTFIFESFYWNRFYFRPVYIGTSLKLIPVLIKNLLSVVLFCI